VEAADRPELLPGAERIVPADAPHHHVRFRWHLLLGAVLVLACHPASCVFPRKELVDVHPLGDLPVRMESQLRAVGEPLGDRPVRIEIQLRAVVESLSGGRAVRADRARGAVVVDFAAGEKAEGGQAL